MTMNRKKIEHLVLKTIFNGTSLFFCVQLLVYFVGFVYLTGYSSPMTNFNLLSFSSRNIYNFDSFSTYINGVFQCFRILIIVFVSTFFYTPLIPSISKWLNKKIIILALTHEKYYKKIIIQIPTCINLLPFIILLIISKILVNECSAFLFYFMLGMVAIVCFIGYKIINFCIDTIGSYKWNMSIFPFLIMKGIFIINIVFSISVSVYLLGLFDQANQVKSFINGNGNYTECKVYYESGSPELFYEITTNANQFIGYNAKDNIVSIIPMDKILKIEKSNLKKSK